MVDESEVAWRRAREASRGFRAARRRAWLGRYARRLVRSISSRETCCENCCDSLMCSVVRRKVGVRGERRLQTVELTKIVGSVGRCAAFDADFLPTCSCTRDRWERVYSAMRDGKSLPPVELYRDGDEYFVVDGNHRVSVARSMGLEHLEALVRDQARSTPG